MQEATRGTGVFAALSHKASMLYAVTVLSSGTEKRFMFSECYVYRHDWKHLKNSLDGDDKINMYIVHARLATCTSLLLTSPRFWLLPQTQGFNKTQFLAQSYNFPLKKFPSSKGCTATFSLALRSTCNTCTSSCFGFFPTVFHCRNELAEVPPGRFSLNKTSGTSWLGRKSGLLQKFDPSRGLGRGERRTGKREREQRGGG